MTTLDFDHLEAVVSPARLAAYLREAHGSKEQAAELYLWNADVAVALWQLVAHFEVAVRNAMARELDAICRAQRPRALWFNHPTWFSSRQRAAIRDAKAAVRSEGLTEGRVIAQLMLGFWVSTIDPAHEHTLWVPGLRRAFPRSSGDRKAVRARLGSINDLRNDIAHHNRMWKRDIAKAETGLLGAAHWVDPVFADWLAATSTVPQVLARRPLLPPSVRWAAGGG